jgi:hypothetical protein
MLVFGSSSQFFKLGGIIVSEINIPLFATQLQEIRRDYFGGHDSCLRILFVTGILATQVKVSNVHTL